MDLKTAAATLTLAGIEKTKDGQFQASGRTATLPQWYHDLQCELAAHLFQNGLALESDLVDVLGAMAHPRPLWKVVHDQS